MMICRLLLLGLTAWVSTAGAQPPVADLGERLAACRTCHGQYGEGLATTVYNPHLSGKPAGYLFDQLQAFRDGRRHYPQMAWLLRNMDDAYLQQIAAYYAALPPKTIAAQPPQAADTPAAQRAAVLVRAGDPARGVPACSACHGDDLAGLAPNIPALVGLPEEYIVAQFGAWRAGVRKARAPDCMAEIARRLP